MCLSSVRFGLTKIKQEWIGIGYKYVFNFDLDKLRRLNNSFVRGKRWSRKWMEANCSLLEADNEKDSYFSGFHIFLNKIDASNYQRERNASIMKVQFKEITAFGRNDLYLTHSKADCIIANKMRVLKIKPIDEALLDINF